MLSQFNGQGKTIVYLEVLKNLRYIQRRWKDAIFPAMQKIHKSGLKIASCEASIQQQTCRCGLTFCVSRIRLRQRKPFCQLPRIDILPVFYKTVWYLCPNMVWVCQMKNDVYIIYKTNLFKNKNSNFLYTTTHFYLLEKLAFCSAVLCR